MTDHDAVERLITMAWRAHQVMTADARDTVNASRLIP
jgi:hypothetical protein